MSVSEMVLLIYIPILLFLIVLLLLMYYKLTAEECPISQQCMSGKTVLITGATAGIGKATAMDLARRKARIILACRNLEKAGRVKSEIVDTTGNANVEVKLLNLESFDSVRKCAEDVLKTEDRLDVLINNAGAAGVSFEMTKDGCEKIMQTNHLGHFLLTLLLLDLMKESKPSRIINVSSISYLVAYFDLDDMEGIKQGFLLRNLGNFYYRSKLANVWFTTELARRLDGSGVNVNCLHPGIVHTDIIYPWSPPILLDFLGKLICKSAQEGAQTSTYLAVDPGLERVTGKFFSDCRERRLFGQALDRTKARKLFEISQKIVGSTFQYIKAE